MFLCLALQLMFMINGFVSIQLLWKLLSPVSVCTPRALTCLWRSGCDLSVLLWHKKKVIFKQSNFFTELISQNCCVKNSLLKNLI